MSRGRDGSGRRAVGGPSLVGIRGIDVFKGLDSVVLRQIAHRCHWTRYKRNEYVARRYEITRQVYFVVSGLLRVTAKTGAGRQVFFREVSAGGVLGELAAIDGQPNFGDVISARESLIASMSAESFRGLLARHASVRERTFRGLAHSVRDLADRMLDLQTMPVANRVCCELLRLANDDGRSDTDLVIDDFPTHEELSNRVGTSREQVTRELSHLERDGVVLRKGRTLEVRNVVLLRELSSVPSQEAARHPRSEPLANEWPADLSRLQRRALLVAEADISPPRSETDERRWMEDWAAYAERAATDTIPSHEGRSFSDAIGQRFVAVFPHSRSALACAFDLHLAFARSRMFARQAMSGLRIGLHVADVLLEPFQVSGLGVQLAAGLAKLAHPGDTVISVQVRDQLSSGLDVALEDIGEQRMRSPAQTVRAFRTWPASSQPARQGNDASVAHARPSVAVIPFRLLSDDPRLQFAGDGLADETIASLSRVADFFVVSRLSTMAFRRAPLTARTVGEMLGVQYVLSGTLQTVSGRVRLLAELSETYADRVLWNERFESSVSDVFGMQEQLAHAVVRSVAPFIRDLELRRARLMSDDQREAYSLTLLAVDLMHRMSKEDFLAARPALERAITQDPTYAGSYAWLAKWHVLKVATGASANIVDDQQAAIHCAERALHCDSRDALALAVDGLVSGWSRNDLDRALWRLDQAIVCNPNEPLAWLWHGIVHAWRGNGPEAVQRTDQALLLSPLDPMLYYFHSLASTANMIAGRYERAIDFALRSVRANRSHTPSWRTLAASQALAGRLTEARASMGTLRSLEPDLTLSSFRARYPGRDSPQVALFEEALVKAGLPN